MQTWYALLADSAAENIFCWYIFIPILCKSYEAEIL